MVDRSPVKGRLARSTPELIVEKLADGATDDGAADRAPEDEGSFYASLLSKFEQ